MYNLPVTKSPACVSWLQDVVNRWYEEEKSWLNLLDTFMPTVIYAIVIAILNAIYRKIAVKLNEFGNLSSSVNLALLHTGKSFLFNGHLILCILLVGQSMNSGSQRNIYSLIGNIKII